MSIFRKTFTKSVQAQLKYRQDTVKSRTPQSIQLATSRTPWIRMTSGVNTLAGLDKDKNPIFDNTLAKQNILLGGVLGSDKKLKYSIGNTGNEAYSDRTSSGKQYQRGLRPMPGITSVDVKSKSAYGSLREVTVNFICHDIKQLEDLELLYMRPGYTVLVEWGWLPYVKTDGVLGISPPQLKTNVDFYDDVLNGTKDFQTILLDLFKKSRDMHSGNYDAVYGKIQNYSWQARMDGGYDCTTTIITMGEILESLKVNTTPFNIDKIVKDGGVIFPGENKFPENLKDFYAQNYLLGLLYEYQQYIIRQKEESGSTSQYLTTVVKEILKNKAIVFDNGFIMQYKTTDNKDGKQKNYKTYLTLESIFNLINNYIILGAGPKDKLLPFTKLSTYSNTYEEEPEPLLCLSHPLQVSVDTNVCIITNDLFANGFDIKNTQANLGAENGASTAYDDEAIAIYKSYKIYLISPAAYPNLDRDIANKVISDINVSTPSSRTHAEQRAKQYLVSYLKASGGSSLNAIAGSFDKIAEEETNEEIKTTLKAISNILFNSNIKEINENTAKTIQEAKDIAEGKPIPFTKVDYLAKMNNSEQIKKYQSDGEYGVIGNIYVNLDFLIKLATNSNGTSDKKEIKLYDFVKNILRAIQESTGNINNFDIHIDPIDSIARVIDVNYIDKTDRTTAYSNAFQLEVANTSGVVRSYTLQSQIFPEQSSIIAIGAQVKAGGEQGSDNNTLLDFNKGIQDRIIPARLDQNKTSFSLATLPEQKTGIITNIKTLQNYFFPSGSRDIDPQIEGANNDSSMYKNSLRDTIKYVQGITNANSKNRSIIPIKLSLTIDGIGGLVIGHLFKFPDELLPQGYKFTSEDKGVKLLQTIIGLGHKIDNSGWTTTLDAYNMVLNNPKDNPGNISWSDILYTDATTGNLTLEIPSEDRAKKIKDNPWSAAFISYVMKAANTPFASNASHTGYAQALRGGTGGWKALNPAITPLQVGDLVLQNRKDEKGNLNTLTFNSSTWSGFSHGDIITEVTVSSANGIGGNVSDTVFKSGFKLRNKILVSSDFFVVLRPPSNYVNTIVSTANQEYNTWSTNKWNEKSPAAFTTLLKYYDTVGLSSKFTTKI